METDKYVVLRDIYDDFARRLVPQLLSGEVDKFLDYLNKVVEIQRPRDWTRLGTPREILAMTSDREKIVFGEAGFGFYHSAPISDIGLWRPDLEKIVHDKGLLKDLRKIRREHAKSLG